MANWIRSEINQQKDCPELKLWKAVMSTAVSDALTIPIVTKKGKHKVFTELQDVIEARNWFQKKAGTFETVCEALNLDSDRVHKIMLSKIKQKRFIERLKKI